MRWLKAFISKFPPIGRKRETKLETSRKRSAVSSVKLETAIVSTPYALMRNPPFPSSPEVTTGQYAARNHESSG